MHDIFFRIGGPHPGRATTSLVVNTNKVADSVTTHEAWGMGSYCYFNVGPDIHAERAFEVPVTPGVKLHSILTVFLNAYGGIDHVVNDTGAAVNATNQVSNVVSYP